MTHSFNQPPIPQISVNQLAERMAAGNVQLIDVREPDEWAIAHVDQFVNLPLSQFSEWSNDIISRFDPQAETLVLCHHGMRSAQMCQWLMNQGFTNVHNISGGIDAYSTRVDPSVPQY
jgi:rhodanese-related sulfurtransferase